MKRIEFTILIRGRDVVEVDNVTDDLLDFVRTLNPRVVVQYGVDVDQFVEEDDE